MPHAPCKFCMGSRGTILAGSFFPELIFTCSGMDRNLFKGFNFDNEFFTKWLV